MSTRLKTKTVSNPISSSSYLILYIAIGCFINIFVFCQSEKCLARTDLIQLTNSTKGESHFPSVNEDGKIVFVSNSNLTGHNSDGSDELFLSEKGRTVTQITNLDAGDIIGFFRIAGRSNTIVLSSNTNVTHANADRNFEIFVITKTGNQGFQQLTVTELPVQNTFASIDPVGDVIAYQCTTRDKDNFDAEKICFSHVRLNLNTRLTEPESFQFASPTITSFPFIMVTPVLGNYFVAFSSNKVDLVSRDDEKQSRSFEIFTAEIDQSLQPLRFKQLTFTPNTDILDKFTPRISEEGNVVTYVNSKTRTNPDGSFTPVSRIDIVSTDGSNQKVLYPDFEECGDPTINADGSKIVFSCKADLAMNNPDKNTEIFLFEKNKDVAPITQLTDTTGGENLFPYIDPTDRFVVWESTANLTGENADGGSEIFLLTSQERTNPPSNIKPNIVAPPGFSFVDTQVGQTTQASFDISNDGEGDLTVTQINPPLGISPFTIAMLINTPFILQSGESKTIELNFSPIMAVSSMSSITIVSNDPDTPITRVRLFGRGIQAELSGRLSKAQEKKEQISNSLRFVIGTEIGVQNTGDADSGPFAVAVFLSKDQFLDQGDELLKELPAASLPSMSSSIIEEKFERFESSRGKFLIIHIDNLDQVLERNETNNMRFRRIR